MKRTREVLAGYTPRILPLDGGKMSSAVLVPLYVAEGHVRVLLTRRSEHVEHHKGQISFPGGAEDASDPDLRFTALRETHEEIGVHPADIEVLGQIDDFLTISNFRIRPYIGLIEKAPYDFVFDSIEVAEILEVPFGHLLDPAHTRDEPREVDGRQFTMRSYHWNGHVIYGATALMLRQFIDLLADAGCIDELHAGRAAR